MSVPTFLSYAQNCEDVVLWRALRGVRAGRYIEVGANDPSRYSVSRAFYDREWSGITVEPVHAYVEAHRRERPRDRQYELAAASSTGTLVLHEIEGSGLSTTRDDISAEHGRHGFAPHDVEVPTRPLDDLLDEAEWDGLDIHFVSIDVEGAEADVLGGFDLRRWRPWVLVIESTLPLSTRSSHREWEDSVLAAGYRFCLFDGLSRFYVAEERADQLAESLGYAAGSPGVVDDYVRIDELEERTALTQARGDAIRWRGIALAGWADAMSVSSERFDSLLNHASFIEAELGRMRGTLSWRVTAPLRWVRARQGGPTRA